MSLFSGRIRQSYALNLTDMRIPNTSAAGNNGMALFDGEEPSCAAYSIAESYY